MILKIVLLLLSAVPLGLQIPYFCQAWSSSRLDQWDWIYYLLGTAAVILTCRKEKMGRYDFTAVFMYLPMLFLALAGDLHNVNALAVAASLGVLYAAIWGVGSWHLSCRLLPASLIFLSGTPSSSYHISLLLNCPVYAAWLIKFGFALGCFGFIYPVKRFNIEFKKGSVFFCAALLATAFLLLHTKELYFCGKSFIPEFQLRAGEFAGRNIEPDENTKRFFVTGKVKQYRYTKDNYDISVLAVKCGSNIHEIHPASHCLRTSKWTINSEKILYLQDNFAVTEIEAEKGASHYLVWVFFSSDEFSTPSFLGFRRKFRKNGNYFTYQISVPVYGNIGQSRSILQKFVNSLGGKKL